MKGCNIRELSIHNSLANKNKKTGSNHQKIIEMSTSPSEFWHFQWKANDLRSFKVDTT